MALVDQHSRIRQAGVVFHDTLGGPGVSITGITTSGNDIAILDNDARALPA